ncbi:coiled-coil domain-containing protein 106-like [Osmerus mordax]|uniref:coiled-coil domain-containing protein 106-like n=1 Tax=Osmerus mordax TaxID=8014 RepID=UPI00350E9053
MCGEFAVIMLLGHEDTGSLTPSCSGGSSSLGSVSISKVEFLEAKIQLQDKIIKDLEEERAFLREQIMGGKKKSTQPKIFTVEKDSEEDGDMDIGDISPSSPNISESSDSDVSIRRRKKPHHTRSPATVAVPVQAHKRVKGPPEVIHRYQKVLKSFSRVRMMTQAFRINGVDRGTIKMTAPIAELKIVDPETYASLKFDPASETLLSFARRCATQVIPAKIEDMKSKGQLLPLLIKY